MNQYAVIYSIIDMERNAACRPEHVEFLKSLVKSGQVTDGLKFPDYGEGMIQGVLLCMAQSKEEVAGWLARDPAIICGARAFEVREVTRMADGPLRQ